MNMTETTNAVWFTTKGQVVIPPRLRKQFHIEDGTKAIVEATAGRHSPETRHRRHHPAAARHPETQARRKPFAEQWPNINARKRNWRRPNMPAAPVLDSHALLTIAPG